MSALAPRICVLIVAVVAASLALAQVGGETRAYPYAYTGFRNDGSGRYAGCTPPTAWNAATGAGVKWRTLMPAWTASSPIVVGNRVFTLAEPNVLLCLDADTGAVLWQRAHDPASLLPEADAAAARALYATWHDAVFGALARFHEVRQIESILACVDGTPERAFKDNMALAAEPALREAAAARWRALPAEDVAKLRERLAALKLQVPATQGQPGDLLANYMNVEGRDGLRKALPELRKVGYQFETWYGHVGHTFATPVSDGAHVWASFGWGQVVCYDLAGNRVWWRQFPPQYGADLLYTNSPVLAGDKLIVIAGGVERALNAADGTVLWEQPHKRLQEGHAGSPILVRVKGVDLLVTSHGRIYRVADGAVMADKLPEMVATPAAEGDMLFLCTGVVHGTEGKLRAYGYRMAMADDGTLTVTKAWETPLPGKAGIWTGPLYRDGLLYFAYPTNACVLDAATGAVVVKLVPNAFGYTGSHATNLASAGDYVITATCFSRVALIAAGREAKVVACHILDSPLHRDHLMLTPEELRAAYWSRDLFPAWANMMSTPAFAGNRMYVRTFEGLYCIE